MRVLILGGDGYLGWPTALAFSEAGHEVAVLDNGIRRRYDDELGTSSLVPIEDLPTRVAAWRELSGRHLEVFEVDLLDHAQLTDVVAGFRPDTVVHFAEQRSAPYSMIDAAHAAHTQHNNVIGTLNLLYVLASVVPDCHLVKLGTMGEYGTPNIDIEEGWLEVEHEGRTDRMLYPKRPGSMYHLSKVHDSHNIEFACRAWGLRATDLNQGVVYGQHTTETGLDPRLATRLDYDAVFGTVLNRFCVQAVLGLPLTVYGGGDQTRGIIDIRDTMSCVRLAAEHPAERGEFRVFNQLTETLSINELAARVSAAYPGEVGVEHLDNPRTEAEQHYYRVKATGLPELGLKPHLLDETTLSVLFELAKQNQDRVDPSCMQPTVTWRIRTA